VKYGDPVAGGNNGTSVQTGRNVCYYYDCPNGYTLQGNKCVQIAPGPTPDETEVPEETEEEKCKKKAGFEWKDGKCIEKTVEPTVLQKCLADRRDSDEGKACCYLNEKVAKFNNGKCVCEDKTAKFEILNGRGRCVKQNGNDYVWDTDVNAVGEYICDQALLARVNSIAVEYAGIKTPCAATVANMANVIIEYCKKTPRTEEYFRASISDLDQKVRACQQQISDDNDRQNQLRTRIETVAGELDDLVGGLGKTTVWRTVDGKFNTARLVSDSVAGVVLGTAGGLITSNIIKKNQIENGFEDLSCAVGGQVVAGWDDEFMVGIR
jgi:hypothetical protein